MNVLIFVDLVGSTAAMHREGASANAPAVVERLAALEAAFRKHDPTLRVAGQPGDGVLLVGTSRALVPLVEEALRCQAVHRGLPARITIGISDVMWLALPGRQDETVYGSAVNLTSRLKDVCPPGCVALSEGTYAALIDAPWIWRMFRRRVAYLKGLGLQPYWIARSGGPMADGENGYTNGGVAAMRNMSRWIKVAAGIVVLTLLFIAGWGAAISTSSAPRTEHAMFNTLKERLDLVIEMQREQTRLSRRICASLSKGDARALAECYQ